MLQAKTKHWCRMVYHPPLLKHHLLPGLLLLAAVFSPRSVLDAEQPHNRILIGYYSQKGHTKLMAQAVARGARQVPGTAVTLLPVDSVRTADILSADAIIVGSPVYNANVAPPVQRFINGWPFQGAPLRDKIGAAFVTAGGISAGEEIVQMNILHSMLVFGMIVAGGGEWSQAFGASAVVAEPPFGRPKDKNRVDEYFLKKGERLGRRVAEIAQRFKPAR